MKSCENCKNYITEDSKCKWTFKEKACHYYQFWELKTPKDVEELREQLAAKKAGTLSTPKPYHWATGGYGSHARAIIYREGQPIGELALGVAGEVVEKLNAPDPVSDRDAILELCKMLMWRARPQNGDRPHDDYLRAEYFLKKYT